MTQTLYLFKNQNNYYNRKLVLSGVRNLAEILTNTKLVQTLTPINIATGNALECSVVVNVKTNYAVNSNFPDYAVINSVLDDNSTELSRWFVMRYSKIRGMQYEIVLKRDVLADYNQEVLYADTFIEKGFVDRFDPLIYNNENGNYNQLKVKEYRINDQTQTGWIVGYIAKQDENGQAYSETITTDTPTETVKSIAYNDLPDEVKSAITNGKAITDITNVEITLTVKTAGQTYSVGVPIGKALFDFDLEGYNLAPYNPSFYDVPASSETEFTNANITTTAISNRTNIALNILRKFGDYFNISTALGYVEDQVEDLGYYYTNIYNYDGQIIKLTNNKLVKLQISEEYIDSFVVDLSNNNNLFTLIKTALTNAVAFLTGWGLTLANDISTGQVIASVRCYKVQTFAYSGESVSLTMASSRNKLVDAPYDMFALPYGAGLNKLNISSGSPAYFQNDDISLAVAFALAEALGDRLYDLQFLPFAPQQSMFYYDGYTHTARPYGNLLEHYDFDYIDDSNNVHIGMIFYPSTCKEKFTIPVGTDYLLDWYDMYYDLRNVNVGDDVNETIKVINDTEMLRLCSPNYASMFEFNQAKDGLNIEYFTVMYEYKPFNPFIRVAPQFKGIYGIEANDSRGLILAGDYSLSIISDAWVNYQIQNKNYQLMFDRQIQNMQVSQEIAREQYNYNSLLKVLGGTGAGAVGGYKMTGSVGGAIAGAVVGGATSTIQSALGYDWLTRGQKEQISYAQDNYAFTLGNIKALPNTLTKVSAINNLYKIFPILEKYSATGSEITALKRKLKFDGFTINKIGYIASYCNPSKETFIKGQLIRIEATCDTAIASQIAQEIQRGFYIEIGGYSSNA